MSNGEKPVIIVTGDGPLIVKGLERLVAEDGRYLKTGPEMALCRCGASKKKPHCDGSHVRVEFQGGPTDERLPNRVKEYRGKRMDVLDNRGFCSHDGTCINDLPQVFSTWDRPWIKPDKAPSEAVIDICRRCPSGALSYRMHGKVFDSVDRPPAVAVAPYGPLEVTGWIELENPYGEAPPSREHYCLCRCGLSFNKPFCDGRHHLFFDGAVDPWDG